ncbi:MAG: sigma-70 family RNA polymerase sigma factor [Candidatus Kerfeldbacteria bacterium]
MFSIAILYRILDFLQIHRYSLLFIHEYLIPSMGEPQPARQQPAESYDRETKPGKRKIPPARLEVIEGGDESQLLDEAAAGSSEAFNQLWKMYDDELTGFLYNKIPSYVANRREKAEEIKQEVAVKAWNNIHTFKKEATFKTWIYQIAKNKLIDEFRRKKRRVKTRSIDEEYDDGGKKIDPEATGLSADPELASMMAEQADVVREAIKELPSEQAEAIRLFHLQDKSYSEIAEIQGISEGTVMSRLFYARKSLKEKLSEMGQELRSA